MSVCVCAVLACTLLAHLAACESANIMPAAPASLARRSGLAWPCLLCMHARLLMNRVFCSSAALLCRFPDGVSQWQPANKPWIYE